MNVLAPLFAGLARQLAHPRGWFGRVVMTRMLNRRNRALIAAALDQLTLREQTRLLDVGFGGGVSLELAAERGLRCLTGVDPSQAAVDRLLEHPPERLRRAELRVVQGVAEDLAFDAGSFDALISTNTIYFWPDLDRPFGQFWRVLAPGGQMAIGFSTAEKLRSMDAVTRHGFVMHEDDAVLACATRAGFVDARVVALQGGDLEGSCVLVGTRR